MSFQVNPTQGTHKSPGKLNGSNNLLSVALNRKSGGLRIDRSKEERADSGVSESHDLQAGGVRKRPIVSDDAEIALHSDIMLASASGLARMTGLEEKLPSHPVIDPELAGDHLITAKREIAQNPVNALGAQAHQSAEFVMKLLE